MNWQPISTAPKDGTPCVVLAKHPIGYPHNEAPTDMPDLWARAVVAFHEGFASDGYDLGWSLAGPFGQQVEYDERLVGWLPLPPEAPPTGTADATRSARMRGMG